MPVERAVLATELKEPAFAARDVIAGKDARTLAADVFAMNQEEFSAAFRKSPMKRAKHPEVVITTAACYCLR